MWLVKNLVVYGNRRANPAFWNHLLQLFVIIDDAVPGRGRVDAKTKQRLRLFAT
jgi:hypothetical protein